jgi:hypothetical protein
MRGRRLWYLAIFTGLLLWALYTPRRPQSLYPIRDPAPSVPLGTAFDKAHCGAVRGTVEWSGAVPAAEPIQVINVHIPPAENRTVPNPNTPRINSGRLSDALVYLVGVDPPRSAAWGPDPVCIQARKSGLTVQQGRRPGRVAIVRRGDPVRLVSCDPVDPVTRGPLHSIRGRGAAFFTQMLPVPDRRVSRTLAEPGIVELSSGSGYYWLRGYVYVSDHPYAAVSRPDGTIDFVDVPDGEYEAVCWVPNWHVDRFENDPELSLWGGPARMTFRPAVEKRQRVVVRAGQVAELKFRLSASDFER